MQGMQMPGVGKMAVVADPLGAVFGLIEPSA
jgi:predicted enzyme related to lactoylglutathione lyase